MNDLVLQFLVRTWNTFTEVLWAMKWEWMIPYKPKIAHDIVCIQCLKIYTDLIEHKIVGDTKAPLLRCFLSISKVKAGYIRTSRQYMNYQTWVTHNSNRCSKIFLPIIQIIWETRTVKNTLCLWRYHSCCFDVEESLQYSFPTRKMVEDGCFKTNRACILCSYWSTAWKGVLCNCTSFSENSIPTFRQYVTHAAKRVCVLTGWISLRQKLQKLFVAKFFQGNCIVCGKTNCEETVG